MSQSDDKDCQQFKCFVIDKLSDGIQVRALDLTDPNRPDELMVFDHRQLNPKDIEVGDILLWTIRPTIGYQEIVKVIYHTLWQKWDLGSKEAWERMWNLDG